MNENPYAAPQATFQVSEVSAHTKAIRSVAIMYRIIGGCLIASFGLGSLFALHEISNLVISDPLPNVPPTPILYPLLNILGIFVVCIYLTALGWHYDQTGRGMLNKLPLKYRRVTLLAYLLLLVFPLVLLGAYCVVQLRRHWRAYCEESQERDDVSKIASRYST